MTQPATPAAPRPAGAPAPAARPVGIRTLLPYLRAHRRTLITVCGLSLLSSVATLAEPLVTRDIFDDLQTHQPISRLVVVLVTLLVVVALLNGVRDFLLHRTAEGVVLSSRRRLVAHVMRLPIVEYDRRRSGDLLSRVGADTTLLRAVVTSGLLDTATGSVMVVGASIAMALIDPLLFLSTCAGVAVGLGASLLSSRRMRPASGRMQNRIGEMTSAVERALSAARTIRAAGAADREIEQVERSATGAYEAGLRVARLQALVGPSTIAVVQGANLLVLGIGGARVASGAISAGDLVAFVLLLSFLIAPLSQAIQAYAQLQTGLGALERMEEILAVPLETDRPAAGATPDFAWPALEFDKVSFGYAGAAGPTLRDVTFTVPHGTRTALVGPSGAGKSTLLQLVERFYDVDEGALRMGGVDIRDLPRDLLRRHLGYVEQEAPVLAGTLRENLLLTAPDATDAQMEEALGFVDLGHLTSRSGLGLDLQVGEGGVLMSGGERQRIAIARTLLAAPPILLLDEPTSNLDARSETVLQNAIDAVARQRTLLIVAHRLSTVVTADQIVVMEAGQVVAVGRHDELIESCDLYRELATRQLLVS
ncbi:ABC transporter ATP-binding protein [Streptomyces sp. NPDC006012]|uniref:ABC transporter ATP-binding protein n=1 Tax=Streptomyces sp. NPDC006012 TaxID=3364739 RepID=UPI0036A066A2